MTTETSSSHDGNRNRKHTLYTLFREGLPLQPSSTLCRSTCQLGGSHLSPCLSPQREDSRSRQTTSLLAFLLLLLPGYLPYPPKLEVLVSRARAYHVAPGANTTEQHARVMRVPDLRDAVQRRIRMHHDRVRRIPVRRQEFLLVRRPLNRSHLRRQFHRVQSSPRRAIPNVDSSIVRAAAACQKGRLPWAPRKGL